MSYLNRAGKFFLKHIKDNKSYLLTYGLNFFNPNYIPKIFYYQLDEVVGLLKSGKSLIRFGDGEFYLMNYGSIHYQDFDEKLRDYFFSMVREYNEDSPYVLCLNKIPLEKSNSQLRKDFLLHCWLPGKVMYNLFFNKKVKYIDQVLFYYNDTVPLHFEEYLKTKHLVLVTNDSNIERFKLNKQIPFANVSFVSTPPVNAFADYERIKALVEQDVSKFGKEDTIVIAACGPASKPLAYELSHEGIVTIDIGKGIEIAYTDEKIDYIIYPADINKKLNMKNHKPVRVRIRSFLKSILPTSIFNVVSKVWQKTGASYYDVQGVVEKYTALFIQNNALVVQGGPFAGMKYIDKAIGSNYLHKLVGSYEAVLHPVIESLKHKKFDTIVDIGSAEGYYLVGLGRIFKDAKLVGFEIEEEGRNLSIEMSKLNNLSNELVLCGEATASNIAPFITKDTLLICDCEGAEMDILNPRIESNISNFDTAIIELHDFIRPGIKEALTERFSLTHKIEIIQFKMADATKFPFLDAIENKAEQYDVLRERGWQEQEWMILSRK